MATIYLAPDGQHRAEEGFLVASVDQGARRFGGKSSPYVVIGDADGGNTARRGLL
jgi:hypothetical protein